VCRTVATAAALALLAAGLGGCVHYWSRPGASLEEFDRDHRACALGAASNPTEAALGVVNQQRYRACLAGRGWRRAEQPTPPPPGWYRGFE
jgi:hypothetical protein